MGSISFFVFVFDQGSSTVSYSVERNKRRIGYSEE
jgi:hypothetical protein